MRAGRKRMIPMSRRRMQPDDTGPAPFGALFNSDLFSNQWLERRLPQSAAAGR